ncbi:MAG: hypothetical protein AAF616_06670 [Bacteroidota bacterium]
MDRAWMTERNSLEELSKWVSTLKYAYLWKRPSFRDDADYFSLTLNFYGKDDLLKILDQLEIKLNKVPNDAPKPIPGQPYSFKEFEQFKSTIKDFPEFEQPGHITLNNAPTFLWIEKGEIHFTFSGQNQPYSISEQDFRNYIVVEELIKTCELGERVNRSIESNVGTLTLKKYPFLNG